MFVYYRRLSRVRSALVDDISADLSLADAAEIAGLETKYFSKYFHQKTGICFSKWTNRVRVERAVSLMRSRERAITDIAFAVGYNDLRTFERAFKRVTGLTPRQFRQQVKP